jgi:enoyl-CoA hydratase
MATPSIRYERTGRIAEIVLARPERRNALDEEMLGRLSTVLAEFAADKEARVAVLHGEGPSFCAGVAIAPGSQMIEPEHDRSAVSARRDIVKITQALLEIWDCPKPVIARVHGHCFAAGSLLALCCDIVVIADDARVGWPRLPIGAALLSPIWTHFVGPQRAKMMSFRIGSSLSGREAHEVGFAAVSVPAAELVGYVAELAADIARVPSDLLEVKKLANNRAFEARGFRQTMMTGPDWDAIAHTTPTVHEARKWVSELGLKGAIERFESEGM